MDNNLDVAALITGYNISPATYTDILFQHGIDKIYYYGTTTPTVIDGFVSLIPEISESFGLPSNKKSLYKPLQMIKKGCEINAHVDLNFEQFFSELSSAYRCSSNDTERTIISKIIGTLKPYEIIELPVFDTNSMRISAHRKPLNERIDEIALLCKHLENLELYREYKGIRTLISTSSSRDYINNMLARMEEILNTLISCAEEFSKPLSMLLKITKATAYFSLDNKNQFNPLLVNLDILQKEASLRAHERIFIAR